MIFDFSEILKVVYLMIPAYLANMSPVFFSKMNFLNHPVDFNLKIKGKRILGTNKTWRGVFFGAVVGIVTAFIQFLLNIESINLVNYDYFLLIGFLLGFGALFGDVVESFIKRRIGIKPGRPWIPFDQLDHAVMATLLIGIFFYIPIWSAIWAAVFTIPIHLLINIIGYNLKLRKDKL